MRRGWERWDRPARRRLGDITSTCMRTWWGRKEESRLFPVTGHEGRGTNPIQASGKKNPTTFFSMRANTEQVARIDCGVFILGDTQNPTGQSLLPAEGWIRPSPEVPATLNRPEDPRRQEVAAASRTKRPWTAAQRSQITPAGTTARSLPGHRSKRHFWKVPFSKATPSPPPLDFSQTAERYFSAETRADSTSTTSHISCMYFS